MMHVSVLGIGVFGPGCIGWPATRLLLAQENGTASSLGPPAQNSVPAAELLPATERRRATPSTRLALTVAHEALAAAKIDPVDVPAVFASSSGNPGIIHDLCAMLAANDFQISPTKFHNSVHNAASGYYSIATSCRRGATTICAHDGSAAAALLEAASQAIAEQGPVLLVSYDIPYPAPLALARPMLDSWGVALLLAGSDGSAVGARAQLQLKLGHEPQTSMQTAIFESARVSNPTARFLPLLKALARIDTDDGVAGETANIAASIAANIATNVATKIGTNVAVSDVQHVALPCANGGTLQVEVTRC